MQTTAPSPDRVKHDHPENLYRQVARNIGSLIAHGTLSPGERIPSVRQLSRQQEVSIATVTQAYRMLENEGLIEARPQSGYYVRRRSVVALPEPEMVRPRPQSSTVDVGQLVLEVVRSGCDSRLVNFGTALPAPELFPNEQLHRAMARMARRNPEQGNSCDTSAGNGLLRRQIARRALHAGCSLSPDEIVITNGATQALQLCLRAVASPGDTIAIEAPAYYGVLHIMESLGLQTCEIPTYPRHGVCLDELEKRLDRCDIKACLFCLNHSNPLGSCMPDAKKEALVELLARRNIPLIEDDIAGDLSLAPVRPRTAKSFDRRGQVLLVNAFSKTLAPGYRIGWVAAGQYQERIEYHRFVTSCAIASLPQMAIAEYLANDAFDVHLRRLRKFYGTQFRLFSEAISRHFPSGTKVTRPSGGQVLWVELPEKVDSMQVYELALENRISIAPGPIFSPTRRFRNFMRLNCGVLWNQRTESALATLGSIACKLAG
ncbi:MAG TPA: GntR family transcriptional regulator [Verrucomicrobiales bacterium]|nr:GntR family transcriptional regulator [Verrucomicrobiales bacterium]